MGDRVVLLDSSGPLHARFHACTEPRVAVVDGKPVDVAALYSYCDYLRKVAQEIEYDHLIHVVDPDGGSAHRVVLYPDYKAHRPPTHPALAAQKALLKPLLEAFGHTVVRRQGIESDDLIGALARKYAARGDEVLVITSDKDLMQLVKDGEVCLARYVDGGYGKKTHDFYEEADVEKKFGVRPDQVADWLALVGDTTDNIPGVHKVGEKTATKWLQEFGSLASLMTNADTIKGALGDRLRESLPNLKLYRQLTGMIEIDIDIPSPPPAIQDRLSWAKAIINPPAYWADDINGDLRDFPAPADTSSRMKI